MNIFLKVLAFTGLYLLLLTSCSEGQSPSTSISCEFYNANCIAEAEKNNLSSSKCYGTQQCTEGKNICYVVWQNSTDIGGPKSKHKSGHDVKLMGCISDSGDCLHQDRCTSDETRGEHFFCCCKGNLCNSKFNVIAKPPEVIETRDKQDTEDDNAGDKYMIGIVVGTVIAAIVIILSGVGGCLWLKFKRTPVFDPVPPMDPENGLTLTDGAMGHFGLLTENCAQLPPVQLSYVIGKGKYGQVYKGIIGDNFIALKIFQLQGKQSWIAEKEIYNLPQMDEHANILKFLGVDQKHDNLEAEFWLATEYHSNGSLHDFLKARSVSWDELCKIALSIASGLTFLHEESAETSTAGLKPAIAHRDFKSKNVLIKRDMTACIADFGLALVFKPGQPIGDTHGQVGTLRYMAPEVLEGAINFSRDAFLKIDVYACGLVLWELASRCNMGQPDSLVDDYRLPFEAEANNPQLDQMQDLVVNRKLRPKIKPSWTLHPGMSKLCNTIEECWDHDAEARLTASCIEHRVREFQRGQIQPMTERIINNDSGVGSTASTGGDTDNSSSNSSLVNPVTCNDETNGQQATEMTPLCIRNNQD